MRSQRCWRGPDGDAVRNVLKSSLWHAASEWNARPLSAFIKDPWSCFYGLSVRSLLRAVGSLICSLNWGKNKLREAEMEKLLWHRSIIICVPQSKNASICLQHFSWPQRVSSKSSTNHCSGDKTVLLTRHRCEWGLEMFKHKEIHD